MNSVDKSRMMSTFVDICYFSRELLLRNKGQERITDWIGVPFLDENQDSNILYLCSNWYSRALEIPDRWHAADTLSSLTCIKRIT